MAYIRVLYLQNNSVSSTNLFAFYCCFTQIRLQNNVGWFCRKNFWKQLDYAAVKWLQVFHDELQGEFPVIPV